MQLKINKKQLKSCSVLPVENIKCKWKEVISNFNNKKIISINNSLTDVKIYTSKKNIEILKKNY